eukprot:scaffold6067_cov112-Isochrysis_galbana.AAC.24
MAPRQLRLEPIEADSTADKGAKRVRVDSTEESSTQVQKKNLKKKALLPIAASRLDTLCPLAVRGHSPSPPPFFPHPFFLFQAAVCGGWRLSCVHYNSLG